LLLSARLSSIIIIFPIVVHASRFHHSVTIACPLRLQCHHPPGGEGEPSFTVEFAHNMDKRKFLFPSLSGLIGDIAWQILKEGHDVRYYIEAEKERDIADGFVPKSKAW